MDYSECIACIVKSNGNIKMKFDAKHKPADLTNESKKDDIKVKMNFEKCR